MSREAPFQDRLKGLLESVASKYRFDGLEIARVERNYPIGKSRKEADIITFLRGEVPFLIIETKRKVEKETTWRPRSLFKPLDLPVVGQVASYVAIYKDQYATLTPFFATANPISIAVFRTPKNIEDFVELDKAYEGEYEHALKPGAYARLVKDYLIVSEDLELTEEYVHGLLDRLARDYRGAERLKVEPTWALIG